MPRPSSLRLRAQALAPATISQQGGVRYLHLDTPWVQGAMRLSRPHVIELEYSRRMMAWMLWRAQSEVSAGHAVHLGLGAAALTRFTHKVMGMVTTAVEINPTVITACRLWFHLAHDDHKLRVLEADAAQWVDEEAHAQTADVLSIDLYDHDAAAPVLDSLDFYAACHRVLAEGGVMAVNLFGRNASFATTAGYLAAIFGTDQVWTVQPTREGNTVVIAARNVMVPDRETLIARADNIEAQFGLPARKWLNMVRPLTLLKPSSRCPRPPRRHSSLP